MNTIKSYDLILTDSHKSFYGKAVVFQKGENYFVLRSYNTEVCAIKNGVFHRFWGGYSATTMRHINSFLQTFGIAGGGKAWWENQPIETFSWVNFYMGKPAA